MILLSLVLLPILLHAQNLRLNENFETENKDVKFSDILDSKLNVVYNKLSTLTLSDNAKYFGKILSDLNSPSETKRLNNLDIDFETVISIAKSILIKDSNSNNQKSLFEKFIISTGATLNQHATCSSCKFLVKNFHTLLNQDLVFNNVKQVLNFVCGYILDKSVCGDYVGRYAEAFYTSLISKNLDEDFICSLFELCTYNYEKLNADDFASRILKDKPKTPVIPQYPSEKTLKVVHLTDMHVDPMYQEGAEAFCGKPFCCRDKTGNETNPSGYWGSLAECDLPERTIENMINYIATEIKPDLVLWTGDNGSHDVWSLGEDTAAVATRIVGNILHKGLTAKNNIPLYPSIGNHEEKDVDLFNPYDLEYEAPLMKNLSEVYANFISGKELEDMSTKGFYTTKYLDTKLRIISLNSFLCDSLNYFLVKDPTDPLGQIDFLYETLKQAEKDGEKVFIIGHIPPGDRGFLVECNKYYNALLDRFQHIITGHFYGHSHHDEIRLIKGYFDKSKIVTTAFIAPSTST